MPYLDVTMTDSDFRRQFPLGGSDELIIGRAPDCGLRIAHRSLSRAHCKLVPYDGGWLLEDCESTNGTKLNNSQLMGGRPLQEGDIIAAGVVRCTYHIHEVGGGNLHATTYPALDVPSAIQRREEPVEHNDLALETETSFPAPASDEISIDTDDSFIDIDADEVLWDDDEDDDSAERIDGDSLWLD